MSNIEYSTIENADGSGFWRTISRVRTDRAQIQQESVTRYDDRDPEVTRMGNGESYRPLGRRPSPPRDRDRSPIRRERMRSPLRMRPRSPIRSDRPRSPPYNTFRGRDRSPLPLRRRSRSPPQFRVRERTPPRSMMNWRERPRSPLPRDRSPLPLRRLSPLPRQRSPIRLRSPSPRRYIPRREDDRRERPRSPIPMRRDSPPRRDDRRRFSRSPAGSDRWDRSSQAGRNIEPTNFVRRRSRSPFRGDRPRMRSPLPHGRSPLPRRSPPISSRGGGSWAGRQGNRSRSPRRDGRVFSGPTSLTWRRKSPSPASTPNPVPASAQPVRSELHSERTSGTDSRRSSPPVHPSRLAIIPSMSTSDRRPSDSPYHSIREPSPPPTKLVPVEVSRMSTPRNQSPIRQAQPPTREHTNAEQVMSEAPSPIRSPMQADQASSRPRSPPLSPVQATQPARSPPRGPIAKLPSSVDFRPPSAPSSVPSGPARSFNSPTFTPPALPNAASSTYSNAPIPPSGPRAGPAFTAPRGSSRGGRGGFSDRGGYPARGGFSHRESFSSRESFYERPMTDRRQESSVDSSWSRPAPSRPAPAMSASPTRSPTTPSASVPTGPRVSSSQPPAGPSSGWTSTSRTSITTNFRPRLESSASSSLQTSYTPQTPPKRIHPALANLPPIIPGGKFDPEACGLPLDMQARLKKAHDDTERAYAEAAPKEDKLRASLREWDRLQRESEMAAYRSEMAEKALKKLTGEDKHGAF